MTQLRNSYRLMLLQLSLFGCLLSFVGFFYLSLNGLLLSKNLWSNQYGFDLTFILFLLFSLFAAILHFYYEKLLAAFSLKWVSEKVSQAGFQVLSAAETLSQVLPSGELAKLFTHYEFGLKQRILAISELVYTCIAIIAVFIYFTYLLPNLVSILLIFIVSLSMLKMTMLLIQTKIIKDQITTQTRLAAWLMDVMTHINKLRQAYALPYVFKHTFSYLLQLKNNTRTQTQIQIVQMGVDALAMLLLTVLLYQQMSFEVIPLLFVAAQLTALLDRLTAGFLQCLQAREAIKSLQTYLMYPIPSAEGKIKQIPASLIITFENVDYAHLDTQSLLLSNVNFTLSEGLCMALTGPSGSGKSTIFRLLVRLIKPTRGRILVNKIDLQHYDLVAWRQSLGIVLQHSTLLNATIFANIAGDTNLSLEKAWMLVEALGLADDIRAMPMGMFTRVSDQAGESLSGGQRQKVLLARALAKNPRLLLLDEATSAMDNLSQARIQAYLHQQNITRLVAAHRKTAIAGADITYNLS